MPSEPRKNQGGGQERHGRDQIEGREDRRGQGSEGQAGHQQGSQHREARDQVGKRPDDDGVRGGKNAGGGNGDGHANT